MTFTSAASAETKTEEANPFLISTTAQIVAAYVGRQNIGTGDIPTLISNVHAALVALQNPAPPTPAAAPLTPAVPVRKSVTDEFIICLEDGKKFRSLKRHLRTHYNLSPDEYRAKWGLPADYPMTSPSYSATRSKLAKDNGLGRKAG